MALQPGTTLGPYSVTAKIGEGGMGEVYRARDTKLDRDVALKVLPEAFTSDPDRLARFEREAKVLASLNHTNIGHLYGLEEADGQKALVLELVEGPTLADKIAQGPIPIDEALPIAKQIAEALEVAHEQGIIHRDLKPANIKVKDDGTVKVLDFGLAKAFQPDASDASLSMSPTISLTAAATQMGMMIGTAAYMAPEQAKGKKVDKRADVWAFGAVLYEMLTGQKPFVGEDVSDTLATVLKTDPEWDALPADTPPRLRQLMQACLQKNPKQRVHDVADVRLAMEGVFETVADQPTRDAASRPALSQRALPWVAALGLAVLVGTAGWILRPVANAPVVRFAYELPPDQTFGGDSRSIVDFSPDGRRFVYNTLDGLYLRALDAEESRFLSATFNVRDPVFSPAGDWIAYFSFLDSQMRKIAASGGAPITLTDATIPFGVSWEADGTILFGQPAGVMRVSENGGTAELIVAARDGEQVDSPQLLPGGEWVMFSTTSSGGASRWDQASVVADSIRTGERRLLIAGGTDARYLPTGHLMYALEDDLFAVAFDPDRMEVISGPVSMVEGVERATTPQNNTGSGNFSVSANGNLVYVEAGAGGGEALTLALVDRNGLVQRLDVPPNQYVSPRLTPTGDRLAVQTLGDRSEIWTYDVSGASAIQRLTLDGNNFRPVWTPSGDRIAFASDRDGTLSIYWHNADGSGVAEPLTVAEEGTAHWPEAFSPDGGTLLYRVERSASGNWDFQGNEMELWTVSLDDLDNPQVFAAEPLPVQTFGGVFSPDGRWVAYTKGDTPSLDLSVYAKPYPPTGEEERRVSQGLGVFPLWSHDGEELFYRPITLGVGVVQTLRSISVSTSPAFTFSAERPVSIGEFLSVSYYRSFDITPDGDQFLVVLRAEQTDDSDPARQRMHVVLNWFEELKQRVPSN
jgi:serine/threonine-protein kinase